MILFIVNPDIAKIEHAGTRIGRIGVWVQHRRASARPDRCVSSDHPLASIKLCAHETCTKNQQKDEWVTKDRKIACQKRVIESSERRNFQPRQATRPIDRNRYPPQFCVPWMPNPVRQSQLWLRSDCGLSRFDRRSFVFHGQRLSCDLDTTALVFEGSHRPHTLTAIPCIRFLQPLAILPSTPFAYRMDNRRSSVSHLASS